jgi:uncharacterized membrane protein
MTTAKNDVFFLIPLPLYPWIGVSTLQLEQGMAASHGEAAELATAGQVRLSRGATLWYFDEV